MTINLGTTLALALVLALVTGCLQLESRGAISGSEARRMVEAGARIIDVRTPHEFAAGHLPGAVNIPVHELERRMGELEGKARPIVLYCRSGNRSGRAARMLKNAGYLEVHDLGSMSRW